MAAADVLLKRAAETDPDGGRCIDSDPLRRVRNINICKPDLKAFIHELFRLKDTRAFADRQTFVIADVL